MQTQSARDAQRFHGERVEARHAERNFDPLNDLDRSHRAAHQGRAAAAGFVAALVIEAALDEAARRSGHRTAPPRFHGMDGILSAIDLASGSPLMRFWRHLNAERAEQGLDEANYGEAKRAFEGGPTPEGALTLVGRDDIRAVPVPGSRASGPYGTYYGEFKQTGDHGNTIWRVAADKHGKSIAYGTAEAALRGATIGKHHSQS